MHLATWITLDHQVNHQPEITLVLKRRRRTTEPLELLGNLFDLRNLQLFALNLSDLERMPILDDAITSNRDPVLLARGLRGRLNHPTLQTGLVSKDNPIAVILGELAGRSGVLVVLNANVLQSTNPLILSARKPVRDHLRELSIRQRDGIPMRTLIAGINDAIGIRITTAIIDPIVDRSHIHKTIFLDANTTAGLGL